MSHFTIRIERYEPAGEPILQDIELVLGQGDRCALVGANGVGKTTLMRIITGEITDYHGEIANVDHMSLGYLAQIHFDREERTVREELRLAFAEVVRAEAVLEQAERTMAERTDDTSAVEAYSDALEHFRLVGGYDYSHRIHRVAQGLGILPLLDRPIREVSGGQRAKIALAKILLLAPDFLLLDEPTNFIDLAGVQWLEQYLRTQWHGGYLVISHDREFLDRTCDRVYELSNARLDTYFTNYSGYVAEKADRYERALKAYEDQKLFFQEEMTLINRFRAGSRAGFAKSREHALERVERLERPFKAREVKFFFTPAPRSSERIITIKECFIGRTDMLFYIDDIVLTAGQRIGIMGENGIGKSTLLKTILGRIPPLEGVCRIGGDFTVAYYSQMHEELDRDRTVYENFVLHGMEYTRERMASLLAYYGLSHEDLDRRVGTLSGGETSRVLFAIIGQSDSHILILDEPTNHLDYDSRESLEKALLSYPGTILFISHDRYFINKVATGLWIIETGELRPTPGNYADYEYRLSRGLGMLDTTYDDSVDLQERLIEHLGENEAKRIREKYERKDKKKKR